MDCDNNISQLTGYTTLGAMGLEPNAPPEGAVSEIKSEGRIEPKAEAETGSIELSCCGQDDTSINSPGKKKRKRNRNRRRNQLPEIYSEQNVTSGQHDVHEVKAPAVVTVAEGMAHAQEEGEADTAHQSASTDLLMVEKLIEESDKAIAERDCLTIDAREGQKESGAAAVPSDDSVNVIYQHNAEPKVSTYVVISNQNNSIGEIPIENHAEGAPRSISATLMQDKPKIHSKPEFTSSDLPELVPVPAQIHSLESDFNGNYLEYEDERQENLSWNFATSPSQGGVTFFTAPPDSAEVIQCVQCPFASGLETEFEELGTTTNVSCAPSPSPSPFDFIQHAMEVEAHLVSLQEEINELTGLLPLNSYASFSAVPNAPHPSLNEIDVEGNGTQEEDLTLHLQSWKANNPESVTKVQGMIDEILDLAARSSQTMMLEESPCGSASLNNLLVLETSGDYDSAYPHDEDEDALSVTLLDTDKTLTENDVYYDAQESSFCGEADTTYLSALGSPPGVDSLGESFEIEEALLSLDRSCQMVDELFEGMEEFVEGDEEIRLHSSFLDPSEKVKESEVHLDEEGEIGVECGELPDNVDSEVFYQTHPWSKFIVEYLEPVSSPTFQEVQVDVEPPPREPKQIGKFTVTGGNGGISLDPYEDDSFFENEPQEELETQEDIAHSKLIPKQSLAQSPSHAFQYEWPDFDPVYGITSEAKSSPKRGQSLGGRMTRAFRRAIPCAHKQKHGLGLRAQDSLLCVKGVGSTASGEGKKMIKEEPKVDKTKKKKKKQFTLPRDLKLV